MVSMMPQTPLQQLFRQEYYLLSRLFYGLLFLIFLAYAIFNLHIVDTISKIVDTNMINLEVILAGLIAAIIWNLLTWYLGIPSSSSHTLVGGFAGAAVAYSD